MKNGKASWCAIYQTNAVAHNNDNNQRGNSQNEKNNQRYEGHRYGHQFDKHHGGYGVRGRFYGNRDN